MSLARFPLVGFPAWAPKLHVAVVVAAAAAAAALAPAAAPQRTYLLFDFVPVAPTEASTAGNLFLGRSVPGLVREKTLAFAPPALETKGVSRRSVAEIRAFCQAYDARLQLLNNNCYSFANEVLHFVL